MSTPTAFLVVGRRNWGKSTTIRALAKKRGWVNLQGRRFFVRRMSNDDLRPKYEDFIRSLDPQKKPYVLVAYCPEEGSPKLLQAMARKYKICPWILEHSCSDSRTMSPSEIRVLKQHRTTRVFDGRGRRPRERAIALAAFIARHV
jgi:hypothetical protein